MYFGYDEMPSVFFSSNLFRMISKTIITTISLLGIQFLWTVEFGFGTIFLTSLGMKSSFTTLVWLAGPISGLITQPIIGYYSDTAGIGRKPFLLAGALLSSTSILLISTAKYWQEYSLQAAVFGFYMLDFSINIMMASARALIVDVSNDQTLANSVAGIMIGCGNVSGYLIGFIKLPLFEGQSQFQSVGFISVIVMLLTTLITTIGTTEKLNLPQKQVSFATVISSTLKTFSSLSPQIQHICNTQFFVWLGWFPFLFYSTAWIASKTPSDMPQVDKERLGALGMLLFSSTSFLIAMMTPLMKSCKLGYLWSNSLIFYFILFMSTVFLDGLMVCFIVLGLVGVSWAISIWVPFALIGEHLADSPNSTTDLIGYEPVMDEDVGQVNNQNAGAVLGVHNVYICLPQFVSTLVSFSVLSLVEEDGFGWTIRVGAVFSLIGALMAINAKSPQSTL
jgi:solute carrier family 45, member 1/2/4